MSHRPSNPLTRALLDSIRRASAYRELLGAALDLVAERDQQLAAAQRRQEALRDELRRYTAGRLRGEAA